MVRSNFSEKPFFTRVRADINLGGTLRDSSDSEKDVGTNSKLYISISSLTIITIKSFCLSRDTVLLLCCGCVPQERFHHALSIFWAPKNKIDTVHLSFARCVLFISICGRANSMSRDSARKLFFLCSGNDDDEASCVIVDGPRRATTALAADHATSRKPLPAAVKQKAVVDLTLQEDTNDDDSDMDEVVQVKVVAPTEQRDHPQITGTANKKAAVSHTHREDQIQPQRTPFGNERGPLPAPTQQHHLLPLAVRRAETVELDDGDDDDDDAVRQVAEFEAKEMKQLGPYTFDDFVQMWESAEDNFGVYTSNIEDGTLVRRANREMKKEDSDAQGTAQYGRLEFLGMKVKGHCHGHVASE